MMVTEFWNTHTILKVDFWRKADVKSISHANLRCCVHHNHPQPHFYPLLVIGLRKPVHPPRYFASQVNIPRSVLVVDSHCNLAPDASFAHLRPPISSRARLLG